MLDAEKREDAMQITAWHSKARAAGLMALALTVGLAGSAHAQTDPAANYPSKTIKIVVGFAAGGGNDSIPRIIGQKLQDGPRPNVILQKQSRAGGSPAAPRPVAAPPHGD